MSDYWANKNVLVTGANGFVGGNLTKVLVESGANVFCFLRNQKTDTFLYYENLHRNTHLFFGDLCDKDLLTRIISEEGITNIFHLAAQVEVGVGLRNPYLTFETNVRGTYSLLEACRLFPDNLEAIVVASSDKAYGEYPVEKMPYREDYPLIPQYPYDTSKACADMITQAYATEVYSLPIVITRFCNIYGQGQLNFSAVIPDSVRSSLGYSRFIPRSDGSMTRDFLHVEDVASLYLRIGEVLSNDKTLSGNVFNAGPNEPISVKEIVRSIYMLTGNLEAFFEIEEQMKSKQTTGEIDYQCMDFEKVKKYFGWEPSISLDIGLKKTIRWYEQYLAKNT